MLNSNDLKWLVAQTNELNSLLQQICRYSNQVRGHQGESRYLDLLTDRVNLAAQKAQELFNRVAGRLLAGVGTTRVQLLDRPAASGPLPRSNLIETIPGAEADAAEESCSLEIRNPQGARELILLVDDDADQLETTADILEFEDYRILTATTGPEAFQIYHRFGKEIALVILDYFLPVLDGDQVFSTLKAIDPEVRVVLSSGFTEQTQLGEMLGRGLHGFLPKPYTSEKLIEQIRLFLDA